MSRDQEQAERIKAAGRSAQDDMIRLHAFISEGYSRFPESLRGELIRYERYLAGTIKATLG
jgi:hypothetical protein